MMGNKSSNSLNWWGRGRQIDVEPAQIVKELTSESRTKLENDDRRLMDERKPARKEKSWTDKSKVTWVASRARVAIRKG